MTRQPGPYPPTLHSMFRFLFCLALLALMATRGAFAQSAPSLYKADDLSVFADYLYDRVDYVPVANTGFTAGIDFTRHVPLLFQPSLEARASIANGSLVNERSYVFGPRLAVPLRRYHAYADFLIGIGDIHFAPVVQSNIAGDNSIVYSPGGGVDVDVLPRFRARFDFQHQYWTVGHNINFQPSLFTVGISYSVPFRPFTRHGDAHY